MELIFEKGQDDVDGSRNMINRYTVTVQTTKLKQDDKSKLKRVVDKRSEHRIEQERDEDGGEVRYETDSYDGIGLGEKERSRLEATLEEYKEMF